MTVDELNALPADGAAAALRSCCGSARWVDAMVHERPFDSANQLLASADRIWRSLDDADWLEAFRHHPRIGEQDAAVAQDARAGDWSADEQRAVGGADAGARDALAAVNAEYEQKFGYIFIVCATDKSADEIVAIARSRMTNDARAELRVAAEEQRKITRLRLEKLLGGTDS